MGSGDRLRFRFRSQLRLRNLTLGLSLLVALTSSVNCEVSENQQESYAPLSLQQLQQQQLQQQQVQQQHPTQFYSYPTLSYAPPPPAFAFPMAPLGGLGQGQLVGPLTTEQSGLFSALSRSNPDMFYFSPRDQVLYKVSLIPFENLNGNALGGGQPLPQPFLPTTGPATGFNTGFFPTLATTGTGTGAGVGAAAGTGAGAAVAPPTPAPTVTTAQPNNNGTPAIDNSGSPPFAIEFEVEEETGGAYVGGFGAEENKSPSLAPVSSGASAGPIASGAGSGTGSGTGSASSVSGTGSGPASGVQSVSNINQLLSALQLPPPASQNLDEFNNNNFQTYDPSLVSPASSGSGSVSGSDSGSGYSSQEAGYDSVEQVESETEPGGYGSSTEQFSQVVLPSDIRISPELARFLAQLTASANAGLGRLRTATNSVVPSAALPENLDAATGTPGQQERRVRKRMKFKSGGAIG